MYILTNDTLTISKDNKPYSVHRQEAGPNTWGQIMELLRERDYDAIIALTDTPTRFNQHYGGTGIEVRDNQVMHNGQVIATYPATRALEFMRAGLPYEPILNFIGHVNNNPSYRATHDLYRFLEVNGMPLTEDGCFMAYKKVRRLPDGNLVSIADASFSNNIGDVVEMPRNQVDEDPDRTCSYGLHVCSYSYLPHFGSGHWDEVVSVKVNPADVVAIPVDYDNAKMRVSKYEVIDLVENYEERGHIWDGIHLTTERGKQFINRPEAIVTVSGSPDEEDDDYDVCSDCGDELDFDGDCENASCPESYLYDGDDEDEDDDDDGRPVTISWP